MRPPFVLVQALLNGSLAFKYFSGLFQVIIQLCLINKVNHLLSFFFFGQFFVFLCSHVCVLFSADNILLSEDGKDAFLCDFGHSERLDKQGLSDGQGKYISL